MSTLPERENARTVTEPRRKTNEPPFKLSINKQITGETTMKTNAALLADHARDTIKRLSIKSGKMAWAIESWNAGVKQAGFMGVYDFPVEGYTRKAQIIADLNRCIAQLEELDRQEAINDPRTDDEGNDPREWSGASIEADHAEALELNRLVDEAVAYGTHSTNANLTHVGILNAIERIRAALLNLNRYPARFIVKMMIIVRRLTKLSNEAAQARFQEMLARPSVVDGTNEIPF